MRQVVTNLLKNAVQNTLGGSIVIVMAYEPAEETLKLCVIDSGSGMTKAQVKDSLRMLGYLMRTADQNSNGIGLGLFISDALVKRKNGRLLLHSHGPNKGTVVEFTMKIPLATINRNSVAQSHS